MSKRVAILHLHLLPPSKLQQVGQARGAAQNPQRRFVDIEFAHELDTVGVPAIGVASAQIAGKRIVLDQGVIGAVRLLFECCLCGISADTRAGPGLRMGADAGEKSGDDNCDLHESSLKRLVA